MRYFLEIAFKGTNYHGWQIQPNQITIQEEIEKCLSIVLRERIDIIGSGRTDAGVHAKQQFAHFDTEQILDGRFLISMNAILPDDIVCKSIHQTKKNAHARFDAITRSYEYWLRNTPDPFQKGLVYFHYKKLDYDLMNEAASLLLNHEDFTSFSKVHTDVDHFNCTIYKAEWQRHGENNIFHITANRFLRGMVRAIVGTLLEVGHHKKSVKQFEEVIIGKSRNIAGNAAPPEGLYLSSVVYPAEIFESTEFALS